MSKPLAIGWNSNASWAATGYGTQTAQVTQRLKELGHDVAVFTNYGLEGSNTDWNGIPHYQRGADMYSNDVVPAHMHDWTSRHPKQGHILFTLYDVWVFKGPRWADWNVASWVPIDHIPAPPEVTKWLRQDFVTPIAMSQYGQSMIENVGIESLYVPHGIESVFKPMKRHKGTTGRDYIGVGEDKFVVGMNAANKGVVPNRKAFGENLLAFSMFAQKHKDAILYLHTEAVGAAGINLIELIHAVGLEKNQYRFIDPYLYRSAMSQEIVAATYTAMDVFLGVSMGEGFGIPTIEAQACGTRVIVSEFAASTELVGDGWLVEGQPFWDPMQKSFQHMPSVPSIVDSLEKAYDKGQNRSQQAIDFAKQYDADTVFETHWKPTLKQILKRQ